MSSPLHSPQAFIRAIKAAHDPERLTKYTIARKAWDDTTFHVPNKGQIIAEWILNKLLKEHSAILDIKLWNLLSDVVIQTDRVKVKIWLPPLLNRVPLAPITSSLLDHLTTLVETDRIALTSIVDPCLALLWDYAQAKLSSEHLAQCFHSLLGATSFTADVHLSAISQLIMSSFGTAIGNSSNKKKQYTNFIKGTIAAWLKHLFGDEVRIADITVVNAMKTVGFEILFNEDTVRFVDDSSSENNIFLLLTTVLHVPQQIVLSALPSLFRQYVKCARKHRSGPFTAGPSQPQKLVVNLAGMHFFSSCQAYINDVAASEPWSTTLAILAVVEQENLYDANLPEARRDLQAVAIRAIEIMSGASGLLDSAMQALASLIRIDYDLIGYMVPDVLRPLLKLKPDFRSPVDFLSLVIEYHAKTRTMPAYIDYLLDVIHDLPVDGPSSYQEVLSSSVLGHMHLKRLSRSIHTFLTSNQTPTTATLLLRSLRAAWELYGSQLSDNKYSTPEEPTNVTAIRYCLIVQVVSSILPWLPLHTVSDQVLQSIQATLFEFETNVFGSSLEKMLKNLPSFLENKSSTTWGIQVVLSATLRLKAMLDSSSIPSLSYENFSDRGIRRLLKLLTLDDLLLPELTVEAYRALFELCAEKCVSDPEVVFQNSLDYIVRNINSLGATEPMGVCSLPCCSSLQTSQQRKASLILLNLVIDRYLTTFAELASPSQLELLLRLVFQIPERTNRMKPGTLNNPLSSKLIRDAQFWELLRLRAAFLGLMEAETAFLDAVDVTEGIASIPEDMLERVASVYSILLYVPMEYFSRSSRADLARRCIAVDILIWMQRPDANHPCQHICSTRNFLARCCYFTGSLDYQLKTVALYLQHLLDQNPPEGSETVTVTLDLIESQFITLLESHDQGPQTVVVESLQYLAREVANSHDAFRVRAVGCLLQLLLRSFKPADFRKDITDSFIALLETHLGATQSSLSPLMSVDVTVEKLNESCELLLFWSQLLSFGKWLNQGICHIGLGNRLANVLSKQRIWPGLEKKYGLTVEAVFAILFEELHLVGNRVEHLELILATYISLTGVNNHGNSVGLDDRLVQNLKKISEAEFALLLGLVADALVTSTFELKVHIVRVSTLLTRDPPPGTSKPVQAFTARCFSLFASDEDYSQGDLRCRLQTLSFIANHCSDRPAALRFQDLHCIWSLLSKHLAGSIEHDSETSSQVFHRIIDIVSALVRLRRDLIIHTLPHLGMVLRQMMSSMRTLQPQLGSKQSKFVTDTLPRWIGRQHLSATDVRAYARLLVNLTTKTLVRNHSTPDVAQKAESLAKPFSKHSFYVIKAYIDAINDPLCIVPLEVRKELQPGLFALCDMLSEHSRDAMMVSALDAGGKMSMKMLWKDYERQKYVGRG